MPRLRADLIFDLEASAIHLESLIPRANRADMRHTIPDEVAQHRRWAGQAAEAELFWATGDMARLALEASLDVPGFAPAELPAPEGIILFGEALPALASPPLHLSGGVRWRGDVPVWGIWWYQRDDWTLGAQVIAKATDLPGRMLRGSGVLQPMFGVVAPSDRGVVFGDVEGIAWGEDGSAMPLDSLGVLAWLSAASHLMGVPTVAQRRRLDARTGKEAGPRSRPQDVVRLVDLRPMRYERVESDGSGREYRHRWVVRGHWAQQAHGPGRSLRKTIYREPYIKGPEGAPLLATETVHVWRR